MNLLAQARKKIKMNIQVVRILRAVVLPTMRFQVQVIFHHLQAEFHHLQATYLRLLALHYCQVQVFARQKTIPKLSIAPVAQ